MVVPRNLKKKFILSFFFPPLGKCMKEEKIFVRERFHAKSMNSWDDTRIRVNHMKLPVLTIFDPQRCKLCMTHLIITFWDTKVKKNLNFKGKFHFSNVPNNHKTKNFFLNDQGKTNNKKRRFKNSSLKISYQREETQYLRCKFNILLVYNHIF